MTAPKPEVRQFKCRLGRNLEYEVTETGDYPDLIIANAYGVSTRLWDPVVERMSQNHRVFIWNMRGFKDDEYDLKFSLQDHAQDLVDIADHAGIKCADMFAYCSGTKVALHAYTQLTDRIRSLLFVGGNFWPLDDYGSMKSKFALNLHKMAKMIDGRPIMAPLVVAMMGGAGGKIPMVAENMALIAEEYRDLVVAPFANKHAVSVYAGLVKNYYQIETTPYLENITVPTLVIGAGEDAIVDPGVSPAAAQQITGATYQFVDGFNHFPMIEKPEQLTAIAETFLGNLSLSTADQAVAVQS